MSSIPHQRPGDNQDDYPLEEAGPVQPSGSHPPLHAVPPTGLSQSNALVPLHSSQSVSASQPPSISASQHQFGWLERYYLLYFHALLRFLRDDTNARLMSEQHFEDCFDVHQRSLFGALWHSVAMRLTHDEALASVETSLNALPAPTPGRQYSYDEIVSAYPSITRLSDLSRPLPGQPVVGPWYLHVFSPLLRASAFGWLRRRYNEDYLNRTN